tara:strand:- start:121 stop:894 length:774 start_codon:yes stop_codon:yes gene_type:complete
MIKKIHKRQFTEEHLYECNNIKRLAVNNFNLNSVANNICLIFQKLKELNNVDGDFVECGTYRGNTLIPTALYSSQTGYFLKNKIIGIDTFKGFPVTKTHSKKDLPSYFKALYLRKKISEDHFKKAKKRTNNFEDISHLENNYFSDVKEIFKKCSNFKNVLLIKGTFEEITPSFKNKIAILHLDADLYNSYLVCLNNLYENVVDGGVIIFDEYYSHKYPGAKVAVDEFFEDKFGYFETYITSEGHERWCFIKKMDKQI